MQKKCSEQSRNLLIKAWLDITCLSINGSNEKNLLLIYDVLFKNIVNFKEMYSLNSCSSYTIGSKSNDGKTWSTKCFYLLTF